MPTRDLIDRPIIITGASSGIGAATAVACAEAGMDVILNGRRAHRLEETAAKVRKLGRRAEVIVGDVSEQGMSETLLEASQRAFGGVDVVFANAGFGIEEPMIDISDNELRRIFDVNFFAGAELCRAAAKRLLEQGRGGHLLMCSSCMSRFTLPRYGAYSATKAAQNMICRAMNMELSGSGVHVTSVHPITTLTEFHRVASRKGGIDPDDSVIAPDHAAKLFVQSPQRVARAIIRCLRRPRPEVWTSHIVRGTTAIGVFWPRFMDWAVRKK